MSHLDSFQFFKRIEHSDHYYPFKVEFITMTTKMQHVDNIKLNTENINKPIVSPVYFLVYQYVSQEGKRTQTHGNMRFDHPDPKLWKALSLGLRQTKSLFTLKIHLKTHVLNIAFNILIKDNSGLFMCITIICLYHHFLN